MELLVILSYVKPTPSGYVQGSLWRAGNFPPKMTRADLLQWAIDELPPEMRGASITFFSAEPNRVGGEQ